MPELTPTRRRQVSRITSYVVFALILVFVIVATDWGSIAKNFLNMKVAKAQFPMVFLATLNTLWYTAFAFAVGVLLATVLALMKMSKGPFHWLAVVYIELFRGLPALLTIILFAMALPIAFKGLQVIPAIWMGLFALVFVTSAYTAEIIRAGIEAVPKGQREASRSLGMSHGQTTVSVILPQAFRIVIPPLTNEFVLLLKDTSLLFIIGATVWSKELTQFGKDGNATYFNSTPLIVVAVFYMIITIPLTYLVSRLEKKMAVKK